VLNDQCPLWRFMDIYPQDSEGFLFSNYAKGKAEDKRNGLKGKEIPRKKRN